MILEKVLNQCLLERRDLKNELQHILSDIVSCKPLDIYFQSDRELSESQLNSFYKKWSRLLQGEPLAHILEKWDFYGREFFINPSVFIPRPETEELVECVLRENKKKNLKIVDFGSGTGCIGMTLGLEMQDAEVTLVESSKKASQLIRKNINKLNGREKINLITARVENVKLKDKDIVVANPPYICRGDTSLDEKVKKYEPERAIFAGEGGFSCIKAWAQKAREVLKNEGTLYMEIGYTQRKESIRILRDLGYVSVKAYKDLRGRDRYISGKVI